MNILAARQRLAAIPWLAEGVAVFAGILYFAQSWIFAHTQDSILDEGAYLYKGLLFVTGQYRIYQDYGPWSNHMPLSFLIPGVVQVIFGPGLRSARYFAILIGMLMLVGLWIIARRLGGRWWAAAAILIVALNPATIKMYSVFVTQGLIACMLVWTLVLVIGKNRPMWQISAGAVLASLMLLTRINLTPVLPLLVLYAFWQHGKKAGMIALLAGGSVVVVGYSLFWPNILRMWGYWLPASITPFLNAWRPAADAVGFWSPNISTQGRVASFFHGFRFQFIAMVGAISAWLLWPKREGWKNRDDFRSAVFLSAIFVILWLAHLWATMGKDYCVYCLAGYISFFSATGILLLIITASIWNNQLSGVRQLLVAVVILVISTGIGFGAFEDLGDQLAGIQISRLFLGAPGRFSETVALGDLLANKFLLEYQQIRRLVPTLFGLGAGIGVLVAGLLAWYFTTRHASGPKRPFAQWALIIFLLVGAVSAPTVALGGGYRTYDCNKDVLRAYQLAGDHLAQLIPPGSSVYWRGRLSVAPLLYVPRIKIYPAQINGDYSLHIGGDPDTLEKYGFWNEVLARRWAAQADFILIARHYYSGWLKDYVNAGGFDELEPTPAAAHCSADAQIRIFRKKPGG